ncbi:hypothetical protein ACFU8R_16245 [Pseudonocardia alni]|uniref:hypothetical protein n=1 Tax=Pseudonocardia alni TaxID=33907 RepID=UPI0036AE3CA0
MTRTDTTLLVGRGRMFVVSYAPLAMMFAVRFAAQDRWILGAAFFVASVVGILDGIRLVSGTQALPKHRTKITEIKPQGGAVAAYLATYLLPFLGNLPSNWGDWIAYGIYFATAAIVYVRSDLAVVNPTLYALGYQVVSAKVDGAEKLVVSRSSLLSDTVVTVSESMGVVVTHKVWDDPQS